MFLLFQDDIDNNAEIKGGFSARVPCADLYQNLLLNGPPLIILILIII